MEMFPLVSALTDANGALIDSPASSGFSLDSILNILVPIAIFIMFGFLIYKNFTKEIDSLIAWARKKMADDPSKQQVPITNPYMMDGTIVYK